MTNYIDFYQALQIIKKSDAWKECVATGMHQIKGHAKIGEICDVVGKCFDKETASYILAIDDAQKVVEMNVGSANTLTVPPNSSVAFPVGTSITVLQTGAGQTTITAGAGVTINATPGLKLRTQWSLGVLIKRATDTWVLAGDVSA